MFGLSFGELLIIAVLALLLLGPERLPEAAKTIGKSLRDLRRVTDDLKDQMERELDVDERRGELGPHAGASVRPNVPPPATAQNVPGLEAALAEPGPSPSSTGSEPGASPSAPQGERA